MDDLIALDRKNIWHPFTPLQGTADLPLVSGAKGVYLHTADGRKILDGISSWWVNLHGHCNEHIAKAIATQAAELEHVIFAGFTHAPAIRLSRNLLRILPANQKKVFFSDNGSTAVEVALKMAMQYWHNHGLNKQKVVAIKGAYHGDTFGSMSVADRGLFTVPFRPWLFEADFIDFPEGAKGELVIGQFEKMVAGKKVAAFIFEPLVQAAGGMRTYSAEVLDDLLRMARDHDVICIADEVFTGFGRTGRHFAVDYLAHQPDIVALSKGVTGGFLPLGVTSCSDRIIEAFDSPALEKTFFHGHSYTANPLACAAANASFELLTGNACQERIQSISRQHLEFAAKLQRHRAVREARALGTILAIELHSDEKSAYENSLRAKIYPWFLERNILLRPLGNVLYFLPPYVIADTELVYVYDAIERFLREVP